MRTRIGEQLRRANPVRTPRLLPDERLLASIVSHPRAVRERAARRTGLRRPVALLAAAAILIGALVAASSKFAPQYFGASDEPTPASVVAAIRADAGLQALPGEIDESALVRLASFEMKSGRATIYAAPVQGSSAFCSIAFLGDEVDGGSCSDGKARAIPWVGGGSSEWGDIRILFGRLVLPATGIEVVFEDGGTESASTRDSWWIYVVGGDETEPGRRPVALRAVDATGEMIATQPLDGSYFTNRT
jgi:hypothetical protein